MSLFSELKRRNVFRVAAAYVVIAWLLIQVLELAADSFEAPAWVMKMIITGAMIGFVPAVLFSWAFELTPEGLKKESEVTGDASRSNHSAKKLDYITLIAAVGVAGLFAYQQMNPAVFQSEQQSSSSIVEETSSPVTTTSEIVDASIAVLPFADLSPDKDQSHFSDGIAEEILNVLVRIESLNVASRTSAFGFKGQESLGIPLIAEKLRVRHVLEGSVRKSGDNVRITAQLIDAQTDVHLWSDTFDRKLTTENIFAVQDEIAGAIVSQLGLIIGDGDVSKPSAKVTTESVDAYELFLKAQGLFHAQSGKNLPETIALFEQAVAIDPAFAEAWAGLSAAYLSAPSWHIGSREDYIPKAQAAADRASELDDSLALPYSVRGGIISRQGDVIRAIEQMDLAIKRDPSSVRAASIRAGQLARLGYFDLAEDGYRRCLELDPSYEVCRRFLSFALLYQGDVEEANRLFEAGLLKGQVSYLYVFENYYSAIGDTRSLALLLFAQNPDNVWPVEAVYRFYTDTSFSLDALNTEFRAFSSANAENGEPYEDWTLMREAEGGYLAEFLWSPYLPFLRRSELRDEYISIRRNKIMEFGLDDYWRKHGFPPQCRAVGNDDFECDLVVKGKN